MIRPVEVHRAAAANRVRVTTIEKDYCLTWILHAVASLPELASHIVFKGGTALRKVYFPDWRFSEDLDFTAKIPLSRTVVLDALQQVARAVHATSGIQVEVAEPPEMDAKGATCYLSYVGPLQRTGSPRRVKIDISFDEPILTPTKKLPIFADYSDQRQLAARIECYSLEEIWGLSHEWGQWPFMSPRRPQVK